MGLNINTSRISAKKQQEAAKAATESHNKKNKVVEEDISVEVEEVAEEEIDDESYEEKLRYELSTMKKAGLKAYAEEHNVSLGTAKTIKEIIEEIVFSLT